MPICSEHEAALFALIVDKPVAEREAILNVVCGDDGDLRRRLEALLAAHYAPATGLDAGPAVSRALASPGAGPQPEAAVAEAAALTRMKIPDDESVGQTLGRYKLLEKVGEGGCGVVYVAEQTEPVRRRVALKVIKLGMDTRDVVARFEAERQALAMMDHPNIARVFDAGATETGRPYFVMELVRGIRITDYCDEARLSTAERLNLFINVCHAVQHAHQKGVIHRDLKPSNILVTLHDGVPVPKVIDFGIAKATGERLTNATIYTRLHQFIGTPAYMSPEQAEMSGLDIDTRSDVYSLGVLLYELLAGSPPFDSETLLASGLDAMRRTIREVEPPRPSTRLAALKGEERTTAAKRRAADPAKLVHQLQGDLDWIVMKCLEKDRSRRYETANGLATDLKRHLSNEPVSARPPSAAYRFQKAWRRNKLAFSAAAAVGVAIVTGAVVSYLQADRARTAEALATERLEDAEDIAEFLTKVFESPDPTRDGREIKAVELLDRTAKNLESELASQPDRLSRLQLALGNTYVALGVAVRAVPLLEKARDYHLAHSGLEHSDTLNVMNDLAAAYDIVGRKAEALKLYEEILPTCRKVPGFDHPDTIAVMSNLANALESAGRRDEALRLAKEALELRRKVNGPEHPDTLKAMHNLANFSDGPSALKLREEALLLKHKVLGSEHPGTLSAMTNLANSYVGADRGDDALRLSREALDLHRKVNGPEHPDTIGTMHTLANACEAVGRREEALDLREQTLTLRRKVNGHEHPDILSAMQSLLNSYRDAGRLEEALELAKEVLAVYPRVKSLKRPDSLFAALATLANTCHTSNRLQDALQLRETLLPLYRSELGPEDPETLMAMNNLAVSRVSAGQPDKAYKLLAEALPLRRKMLGPEHPDTFAATTNLATVAAATGRLPEAVAMQEDVLVLMRRVLPPDHPYLGHALNCMAKLYEQSGRNGEAAAIRNEEAAVSSLPTDSAPPVVATLVPPDSEWKWLHPADGKDPAAGEVDFHTAFPAASYDDSSWQTGKDSADPAGGFGYGRGFSGVDIGRPAEEAHRLTAYFRHRFRTDKPHTNLELRCQRDDGIIIYLDGKEVFRDNVPEGPDNYRLPAIRAVEREYDGVVHLYPIPGTLAPGDHVLAISLHNAKPPSSDLRIGGITLVEITGESQPQAKTKAEKTGEQIAVSTSAKQHLQTLDQILESTRKAHGPEHPNTIVAMTALATACGADGSGRKAISLGEEALTLARKTFPAGDPRILEVMRALVPLYRMVDLEDEARKLEADLEELAKPASR